MLLRNTRQAPDNLQKVDYDACSVSYRRRVLDREQTFGRFRKRSIVYEIFRNKHDTRYAYNWSEFVRGTMKCLTDRTKRVSNLREYLPSSTQTYGLYRKLKLLALHLQTERRSKV